MFFVFVFFKSCFHAEFGIFYVKQRGVHFLDERCYVIKFFCIIIINILTLLSSKMNKTTSPMLIDH